MSKRGTKNNRRRLQLRKGVVTLAFAACIAAISGCATGTALHQGGANPDSYNPETGYPLVGSATGSRIH